MIAFFLYKLGSALNRLLPASVCYGIALVLADLNFLINRRSRRAVIANLTRVLGSEASGERAASLAEIDRIARRVFHHFAFNIVDFMRFPLLDLESLRQVVDIEGWEHLQRAHAEGRGVILLSAHIGNWEIGGAVFGLSGIRLRAVALDHGAGRVTRFFAERRRAKGIKSLPLAGSTYAILEGLRAGEAVALIVDRDFAHQGRPVAFFGETTMMPRAHASLALKTGAPLLPCFPLREPNHRFRLIIRPPVSTERLPADDRVGTLVARCLRVFEEMIRRHPDQWCVFVPLWGGAEEEGSKVGEQTGKEAPPAQ